MTIEDRFKPRDIRDPEQEKRIHALRAAFVECAAHVDALLEDSREKSIVLTKLEEACFFAVACVAREELDG